MSPGTVIRALKMGVLKRAVLRADCDWAIVWAKEIEWSMEMPMGKSWREYFSTNFPSLKRERAWADSLPGI